MEQKFEGAIAGARNAHYEKLERYHAETEAAHLRLELEQHRRDLDLTAEQAGQIDRALHKGTLDDLRRLAAEFGQIADQRRRAREEETLRVREQQREIRRLELELETIPAEKRGGEAAAAWTLYQQAQSLTDLKERLNLLKEARKKVPKELRPERF